MLLVVSILALNAAFQSGTQTTTSGYYENPYTRPIPVHGDLAGVGPFNYTYCGPQCQPAAYVPQASSTGSTCTGDPLNCYISRTQSTNTNCGTDPLNAYICTETIFGSSSGTSTCYFIGCPTITTTTTTGCFFVGCSETGHARIAVVLAQFKDVPPNRTRNDISNEWNTQVVSYYNAVSHGLFDAHADIYGWYTLPNNESYYGADCPTLPAVDCGIAQQSFDFSWTLGRDGISIAEYNGLNLTQYQWVVVMHSGNGQESEGGVNSPYSNDVWSATYFQGPPAGGAGKGVFTEYSIVPETERGNLSSPTVDPLGIWSAEFGHQLGFPDMFLPSENTGPAKTGHWELESIGAYNGNPSGSDPAYTLTINQYNAHWLQGHFVDINAVSYLSVGNGTVAIKLTEVERNSGNMSFLIVSNGHFYWLEARQQTGWDTGIPGNGVLILEQGHLCAPTDASCSSIINANPSDPTLNHAAWQVGMHFTSQYFIPGGGITIESYDPATGVYTINIT